MINIRKKFLEKTRERMKTALKSRDMLLGHVSRTIDELDETINLLGERLEEWYGVYLPEFTLENRIKYAEVVSTFDKANPDIGELTKLVGADLAKRIIDSSKKSLGAVLQEEDIIECRVLAEKIIVLDDLRKRYNGYEEKLAKEICPNIACVAGYEIAAKLIAHVGSLARLAILPASTIQVIGAEKALFKHLKNRRIAPPKHGILFQHPRISSNAKKVRGKIARTLANKIALAAKADVYTKRFIAEDLKKQFEARCDEILAQSKRMKEKELAREAKPLPKALPEK